MIDQRKKTKFLTYIALSVAIAIGGGFAILQFSLLFPFPGTKYMFMSPFLSVVLYMLLFRIQHPFTAVRFGLVFGFIMFLINAYMGLAILITSLLTEFSVFLSPRASLKPAFGAVSFATATTMSALSVSKYLIGGVFQEIPFPYILISGCISSIGGIFGCFIARRIILHAKFNRNE